jgi:hypothetical protein
MSDYGLDGCEQLRACASVAGYGYAGSCIWDLVVLYIGISSSFGQEFRYEWVKYE